MQLSDVLCGKSVHTGAENLERVSRQIRQFSNGQEDYVFKAA